MFLNKVEICGVNTSELPLLSDEEKENLFIQIEQGNMDAREQYVKGNLRLVLSVIQRFSSNHEHADDLFQVGCIGLMKAIDSIAGVCASLPRPAHRSPCPGRSGR